MGFQSFQCSLAGAAVFASLTVVFSLAILVDQEMIDKGIRFIVQLRGVM